MLLRRTRPRSAFSLIELLMVILILVILASLLLSGVNKVLVYSEEVRTMSEIKQLEQACEAFKQRYGRYPPSRIVLIENGAYDPNIPLHAYSINYLAALFPGIYLSADPGNPHQHDWNGDGAANPASVFDLIGSEALVYFLGGPNLQGFCTDKTRPTLPTPGRQREGPFYVFNVSRLAPGRYPNIPQGFIDLYGMPYAYFLARDVSSNNYPCAALVPPVDHDCYDPATNYTITNEPSFRQFVPYWQTNTGSPQAPNIRFFRADKFQIISAGKDLMFGGGGNYNEGNPQASQLAQFLPNAYGELADADNLTNFTEGRLLKK